MTAHESFDLAAEIQTAAEAFGTVLGCVLNGEVISPALREVSETAIIQLLDIARNLRAAKLNVDDDDIEGEQSPAH